MKEKILHIIYKFGFLFSSKWIDTIKKGLRESGIEFRSGWNAKKFLQCGNSLRLQMPFKIIGYGFIKIGHNFSSLPGLRLEAYQQYGPDFFSPEIIIGNNVNLNFHCHIACIDKVVIGDNVLMASRIFITDHFHGSTEKSNSNVSPVIRKLTSKGPVVIEDNVWIGEGVVIMPGVRIGKGSIIGANAVVTKSFPENSVIGGIPATLIKKIE